MTPEERAEPLPDLMYSRDVAVRLLRHAAWSLFYPSASAWTHDKADVIARDFIYRAQREVVKMSLGDFLRIKTLGTPDAYRALQTMK